MKRMKVDIKEQIIDLLRDDMEYKEGNKEDGSYYSQWIFGTAIKELSPISYLCRTVIKTSESEYVDGTDILVNFQKGKASLDLSFAEDDTILNGSPAVYSIDWMNQLKGSIDYLRLLEPKDIKIKKDSRGEKYE